MVPVKTYRDLIVWQKPLLLVTDIYRITRSFPKDKQFGFTNAKMSRF